MFFDLFIIERETHERCRFTRTDITFNFPVKNDKWTNSLFHINIISTTNEGHYGTRNTQGIGKLDENKWTDIFFSKNVKIV